MPQNSIAELVNEARERLRQELRAQAEHVEKLEQNLQELRSRHQQLEQSLQERFAALERFEAPAAAAPASDASLEKVLAAVRDLITATLPEQVLEVLTEEAQQLGVRAAVFDIRGKAAWGSSARGFGAQLSDKTFRSLVVPLNQDNPFRQVYETGGHVDANAELLKKTRNVLEKLKPDPGDPVLLLPIRSAGAVSAIFYADAGEKRSLPVEALKILTEFAGAQLDRLMALSGGVPAPAVVEMETPEAAATAVEEVETPVAAPEPIEQPVSVAARTQASAASVIEPPPRVEEPVGAPAPSAAPGLDLSQLSEADQKIHKDAKRFAKLLVSEIDLYNKGKVAEGRKNKDLYRRLKADIDRSRQTYAKRFGKTSGKSYDYFHEELVRTLASNDSSNLGSDYPGPSV